MCSRVNYLTISLTCRLMSWDDRFTETSTELFLCVTCLNLNDSFSTFNKEKLICLAYFYLNEFFIIDLMVPGDQLDSNIIDICK